MLVSALWTGWCVGLRCYGFGLFVAVVLCAFRRHLWHTRLQVDVVWVFGSIFGLDVDVGGVLGHVVSAEVTKHPSAVVLLPSTPQSGTWRVSVHTV